MHLLETDWFLKLVQKSGSSPQAKLIGIFDVLADWLEAPQIGTQLLAIDTSAEPPAELFNFLVTQANACGAALPEALANQLYFMLMCSVRDYTHQQNSLPIARQTAQALIQAQSQPIHAKKFNQYAIASLAAISITTALIASFLFLQPIKLNATQADKIKLAQSSLAVGKHKTVAKKTSSNVPSEIVTIMKHDASPSQTAEMFAKIEQMRKGTCIFPEVLMLPQKQRDVYLQSVVHGEIPSSIEDQLIMAKLMEKVRCNYTPMLMQNSVG